MKALRTENDRQLVQSVMRAMDIMEALKDNKGAHLSDLEQRLSLSKGTVHRLLSTLAARGYVAQNSTKGTYRLGLAVFQLASAALDPFALRDTVRDYLEDLRDLSGETVHLGVLDRGEAVYIDRVDGSAPIRAGWSLGQHVPVHATALGKVLIAFRPEAEVRSIIGTGSLPGFTRSTITDSDVLLQHLELVRGRGYAIDDEELAIGLRCIAFPIHDFTGNVGAGISIAGPTFRLTMEEIEPLARKCLIITREVSARLGYRGS